MATVSDSRWLAQDFATWQCAPRKTAWLLQLKLFSFGIVRNGFFKIGGCRGVCAKRLVSLDSALGTSAATTARDSAEVRFLTLRENAASCVLNREQAARSRRCAP